MKTSFRERYGPWALVAGGSLGLGAAYSRQLAERGLNVVLVAEADDPLQSLARSLASEYGVQTRAVVADLGETGAFARVDEATRDLDLGLLVYNAAYAPVGRFLDVSLEDKLRMLEVNCRGLLLFTHHYGQRFARRGRGGMIIMASLSAFQGHAMVGTYAATKAFDLVLGESLWEELRDHGVDVLTLCPGATRTPGFESSKPRLGGAFAPRIMEAEEAVKEALDFLGQGPTRIAGRMNRFSSALMHRLLPRRALIRMISRTTRAMYDRGKTGS